ncbi:hypothetical protein [Paracoccus denitrificans]|jgi:hypothetical protein|uniref:hypothetical protein n=1 Tax=Paracoccus denitrificans TaxID=266 RepID=UPI0002F95732|nr:hypothetical protein [Paracoccus denitrificans]MBB4625773.1 hypothetical protein [Paracoccus denitrificans]MCU7427062.1 hypothetical protein [Paracoccus denitrificans]QAR26578.1 hypothetical protein EO213_09870 [Paracoccus denitrificans]UPV95522.1 hypothetical protein M0K93_02715 [Paracoccus denitrificans]WQO32412.1 hypothetical protein U0005_08720 [Paracoccus denitrificans]
MNSHEDEPAARRTPFAEKPKPDDTPPEPAGTPPAAGEVQSGKTVLLNWCIMLVGFCAIALAAYWLLG